MLRHTLAKIDRPGIVREDAILSRQPRGKVQQQQITRAYQRMLLGGGAVMRNASVAILGWEVSSDMVIIAAWVAVPATCLTVIQDIMRAMTGPSIKRKPDIFWYTVSRGPGQARCR